ncbi:hypothetical protein ACIQ9P_08090 [Kitasatospora sp. NPDC094019]|uniref:hypothetical protein n=1 Tax=Kitasatospora sp. NPDC094019 TaxID=3364091 RepID=UPI00380730A2
MVMTGRERVRGLSRPRWRLGACALVAALLPLTALTVPSAADPDPAAATAQAEQPSAIANELRALGLTVIENDGLLGAEGPADAVMQAVHTYENRPGGVVAAFTEDNEQGTGYLMLRTTNFGHWAAIRTPTGRPVRSLVDHSGKPTAVWALGTGRLIAAAQPHEEENLPVVTGPGSRRSSSANGVLVAAPGTLSGDRAAIPVQVDSRCVSGDNSFAVLVYGALGSCGQA